MSRKAEPLNKKLYASVVAKAKRTFKKWPSAYASGYVVREYKRLGGKYKGKKPSNKTGLGRWFEEEWVDVCYYPKKVPCGRPKTDLKTWKKEYPYCRPYKRVTAKTPKTAGEISAKERKRRCRKKRRKPMKRLSKH
jgi:hypothetical protein